MLTLGRCRAREPEGLATDRGVGGNAWPPRRPGTDATGLWHMDPTTTVTALPVR